MKSPFNDMLLKATAAAAKAVLRFPQPNYVLLKVAEEAGEVVRAGVHVREGRMEWSELEGEIVQLLAMLMRLVDEGDQVIGLPPHPDAHPAYGAASEAPWKACPREDCEIVRDSVTTGTLKAWVQTYDKHGRPTSVDPNLYETFVHCRRCGTHWLEQRQAGKVSYTTLTPPAEART